jgi:glucose-1-phosphate cytidylyltransferase
MKVVLFCGGMGVRLREHSPNLPKPLALIGYRPIVWHLMAYYAYYGHKEFIMCLGYRADAIKDYFLNYDETLSNDFVLSKGGQEVELLSSDIDDWTIRFVDTGLHANIGMRLKAVQEHLEGAEVFLANYSDGLTDLPLDVYLENFLKQDKVASFVSVPNPAVAHMVQAESDGTVTAIKPMSQSGVRINGGFFAFRDKIFDYIEDGEELVLEPFARMMQHRELIAYEYDGFWRCMDTFKDRQALEEMVERDDIPWQVWKKPRGA